MGWISPPIPLVYSNLHLIKQKYLYKKGKIRNLIWFTKFLTRIKSKCARKKKYYLESFFTGFVYIERTESQRTINLCGQTNTQLITQNQISVGNKKICLTLQLWLHCVISVGLWKFNFPKHLVARPCKINLTTIYLQPISTLKTSVCSGWRKTTVPGGQWPYRLWRWLLVDTVRGGEQRDKAWSAKCRSIFELEPKYLLLLCFMFPSLKK